MNCRRKYLSIVAKACCALSIALLVGHCSGGDPRVPGGLGDPCSTDSDCATGLECRDDNCQYPSAVTCTPQERRCSGKVVEVCVGTGDAWTTVETCTVSCQDGQCVEPVCSEGELRCSPANSYDVEVCSGDLLHWTYLYSCDTTCQDGLCTDRICLPFYRRCSGLDVQECNARGTEWTTVTTCGEVCDRGECTSADTFDCGAVGTMRCNGNLLQRCGASGGWEIAEVCQTVCMNNACTACIPGERTCDGNQVKECLADGSGETPVETCDFACLEGGCTACVPGDRICDGDNVMVCVSSGSHYDLLSACTTSCMNGACTDAVCVPFSTRCSGDVVQMCNSNGTAYQDVEVCPAGCQNGQCLSETLCNPGEMKCNGPVVQVCNAYGSGYEDVEVCAVRCDQGQCVTEGVCVPGDLRCNGSTLQACNADGSGYNDLEVCEFGCQEGQCLRETICVPGHYRCNGIDVEACNTHGTEYIYVESCLDGCNAGQCVEVGCVPFTLTPVPSTIRADESSSSLVVSEVIRDASGTPVPDGTLFTITCDNGQIGASDGDPNIDGIQVRSIEGRIDFSIISPAIEGTTNTSAVNPFADNCSGSAQITASLAGVHSYAEDFTSTRFKDEAETTAKWDTSMGIVDPFPSDNGAGQDQDLVVSGTFNINSSSSHGRLFPDGVSFRVESLSSASVSVRGGVGGLDIGDEAILIQLQGADAGNYEFLEVARIEFATNTVFFSTTIARTYDASGNVMLQRVPRYRSLTVDGTLTANAWDGDIGGVLVVKVLNEVTINGTVDMTGKGFRSGWDACGSSNNYYPGESYTGAACSDSTSPNDGGGGGSEYSYGGWCQNSATGAYASGAGYAGAGTAGTQGSQAGAGYGNQQLSGLFLGSGGGSARAYCLYNVWEYFYAEGGAGGGIVYMSAEGIANWGSIRANGTNGALGYHSQYNGGVRAYGGGGSGGSILLRARSMNVGSGQVSDRGGTNYRAGADGRIRLDYFGISGTTNPDYYEGFGGEAIVQTLEIDTTSMNIIEVVIQQALENTSGGDIVYQVSNDGGVTFHDVVPGTPFTFPAAGSDLRLKGVFNTTSLNPLRMIGIALTCTTG